MPSPLFGWLMIKSVTNSHGSGIGSSPIRRAALWVFPCVQQPSSFYFLFELCPDSRQCSPVFELFHLAPSGSWPADPKITRVIPSGSHKSPTVFPDRCFLISFPPFVLYVSPARFLSLMFLLFLFFFRQTLMGAFSLFIDPASSSQASPSFSLSQRISFPPLACRP